MPIVRTGETEYDREMERWNTPKRMGGHGPDGYERFPQMLYKAFRDENGQVKCMTPPPMAHMYLSMPEFMRAEAIADSFTKKCQITVKSESEYERERANGWRDSAPEAVEYFEAQQREIADAAAEEQFRLRRMSEKAQSEHAAANAETDAHVVEVPAPKKRPGRPARVAVEA